MKYWHELTDEEYQKEIVDSGITVGEVAKKYKLPDWCNCEDALHGILGCWGIFYRRKEIGHKYCKNCDYYKKK